MKVSKELADLRREYSLKSLSKSTVAKGPFEQFAAFGQDSIDNKAFASAARLTMPILAVGAEKSFGTAQAEDIRFVATEVSAAIVPSSGHWVMEENPTATTKLVLDFLSK